jgi:hypothetical protein
MSPRIARIEFVINANLHGINKSVQSVAKPFCERDNHLFSADYILDKPIPTKHAKHANRSNMKIFSCP